MELAEYDAIRALEESHWWYQGLWELTLSRLVSSLGEAPGSSRVLDAGCGTGGLLRRLIDSHGSGFGIELSPRGIEHASRRGIETLTLGSVDSLPFRDGTFDAVISNDVIYHRNADAPRALAEFRRVLSPGGTLLMNLPALESMRGSHDVVVHTHRRFTRRELRDLLIQADLNPVQLSYRNSLLYPAAWLVRKLKRPEQSGGEARSDLSALPALLNGLLLAALRLENLLMKWVDFPVGLSLFCEAKRPDKA